MPKAINSIHYPFMITIQTPYNCWQFHKIFKTKNKE